MSYQSIKASYFGQQPTITMRRNNQSKTNYQLRHTLTREAARLMYEEDVKQYHDAKRAAARRIFGQGQKKLIQLRSRDLPSNGEIAEEVARLVRFHEGDSILNQLFTMRVLSLDVMQALDEFTPRLIGSVSTGRIRKNSDIDLHVFVDEIEQLEIKLTELGWAYEENNVTINKNGKMVDYTHVYIDKQFPIELSVYPRMELRVRTRSSTDGKPIVRLSSDALLQLIIDDHSDAWSRYLKQEEPL